MTLYLEVSNHFYLQQVPHSSIEGSHLGIKHFLYVFTAENDFGASELQYIINYALECGNAL